MVDHLQRSEELLAFDLSYQTGGLIIAGMDEAGRGPLAGNVVTACVVMPAEPVIPWIDDSKRLSEYRREKVFEEILSHALYVGIGETGPDEIDRINILEATRNAMRSAAASVPADIYLIDAVTKLGLKGKEIPIIKGDANSYAIAAASIVAKVTRDRQMTELDRIYPEYGFSRHKGYGTKEHIEALKRLGPCPAHRKTVITHFV